MRRKILTATVVAAALVLVLYTSARIYAALTKTTSIDQVDAWQVVTAGTLVTGTAKSISSSYSTILYLESAYIEAVATDGAEYIIQVSYAADDWVTLTTVKGTAETPATTTIDDAVADSNTVIDLADSGTGDFDVCGRKWFIKDGTIGNSESVITASNSANQEETTVDAVTLCDDVMRAHADGLSVYDRVDEWAIQLPLGAAYVRVLGNNVDADCDCAFTTRVSPVSALQ